MQEAFLAIFAVAAHRPGSSPRPNQLTVFLRAFCTAFHLVFSSRLYESAFGAVN